MPKQYPHGPMTWKVMQRNALKETANFRIKPLNNFTKSRHDAWSVGELSAVCSPIVLKCLHLTCIGRPDILWSVNKLARAVTKCTKVCDKRVARLVSYIHHKCECRFPCGKDSTTVQETLRTRSQHHEEFRAFSEDVQETDFCFTHFCFTLQKLR